MPRITDWQHTGFDNRPIFGNTHLPEAEPVGVFIICHGFKGYKDYGFFPALAEAASAAGLIAHRFNFTHSGMTNNIEKFERSDLFQLDTWHKQSVDLRAVIDAKKQDGLPIILFGHSRGGITALLTAAEPEVHAQIAAVVTAATPSVCSRLSEQDKATLRNTGRLLSPSSRTGQALYINRIWQDQIDADPEWHDPCRAIAAIDKPVMLIHGTDDPTVSIADAHELHNAQPGARLIVIDEAGHTFNCPNPLPSDQAPPAQTQQMIDAACGFAVECCQLAN